MSDIPTKGPDAPIDEHEKKKQQEAQQREDFIKKTLADDTWEIYGLNSKTPINGAEYNRLKDYISSRIDRSAMNQEIENRFLKKVQNSSEYKKNSPHVNQKIFENAIHNNEVLVAEKMEEILANKHLKYKQLVAAASKYFGAEKVKEPEWQETMEGLSLDEINESLNSEKNMVMIFLGKKILKIEDIKTAREESKFIEFLKEFDLENLLDSISNEKEREFLEEELRKFEETGNLNRSLIKMMLKYTDDKDMILALFERSYTAISFKEVYYEIFDNPDEYNKFIISKYREYRNMAGIPDSRWDAEILASNEFKAFTSVIGWHEKNNNWDGDVVAWNGKFLISDLRKFFSDEGFYDIVKSRYINDKNGIDDFSDRMKEVFNEDEVSDEYYPGISRIDDLKEYLKEKIEEKTEMQAKLGTNWKQAIEGIDEGGYIALEGIDGKKSVWKITDIVDLNPDNKEMAKISLQNQELVKDNGNVYSWEEGDNYRYSYDDFWKFFLERLENGNIKSINISSEVPEIPESAEELMNFENLEQLQKYLDVIDEGGKEKGFGVGTIFGVLSAKWPEYVEVYSIDEANKTLSLRLHDGAIFPDTKPKKWKPGQEPLTFARFAEIVSHSETFFRRIGRIDNPSDFVENLAFLPEKAGGSLDKTDGLSFKDGKITKIEKDSNDKERDVEVTGFKNTDTGTLITMNHNKNGTVTAKITIFASLKDLWEKKRWNSDKAKAEHVRRVKREYVHKNISYAQYLQLLQKRKAFSPTSDLEGKEFLREYEEKNNLSQGGDLAKKDAKTSSLTFGHLWYLAKSGKQYVEDYFKLREEEQTAYAFKDMPGDFGRIGIDKMAKLIDGTVDDVKKKHMGAKRREWILKNILDPKAKPKPHQVLAGLMLVYDMSWTLYPDTKLQVMQGSKYIWFERVCQALWVSAREWLPICYEKEAKNREWAKEHIPEEELIKRLFKLQQETNSLVQAIGGGAKIWKMADAGKKAQSDKGAKEVEEESAEAGGRANYIIAKFESNEFEISLGALPKLMSKSTSPEHMGVMFSYVMWWAPNYVHYSVSNSFKNDHIWKGMAYHAFLFSANKRDATLYRDIVWMAVNYCATKNPGIKEEYWKILAKMPTDPFAHADRGGDEWGRYKDLYAFWQKYHKELQPILQGIDPYLQNAKNDSTMDLNDRQKIEKYLNVMNDYTDTMLKYGWLKKMSGDNLAVAQWTLEFDNSAYYQESKANPGYRSVSYWLGEVGYDSATGAISGSDRDVIFYPKVLKFFDVIRDSETFQSHPEYQKKQFFITYEEVMKKISGKALQYVKNDREAYESNLKSADGYTYLRTMKDRYCMDVSWESISEFGKKDNAEFDQWKRQADMERAYQKFIGKGKATGVAEKIQGAIDNTLKNYNSSLSFSDDNSRYRLPDDNS